MKPTNKYANQLINMMGVIYKNGMILNVNDSKKLKYS